MARKYEVVVIGAGPVGATALAMLGHAGISAIGIERETEPWPFARAVHFDGEILRLLQSIGLADKVFAHCRPMCDFRMVDQADETLIAHVTGQLGAQAWPDQVLFHQPNIEPVLRAEIERLPSVELRIGTQMLEFSQDSDGVNCVIETPDGATEVITGRWLLACDGATSSIRRQLGVQTEKLGSDDPWLIVDGILHDSAGIPGDMVFIGHYTRPALWVRLPGERVRMEFKVMPGDDPEEIVTPEGIARLSSGILNVDKFVPDRVAIYTFRARLAEQWRIGNIFLAGDAAHLAPPLFGQGLCAGMRDIVNLVWKLRLVARGLADNSLLDTYESERKEHARYWVSQAANMARLLQTTDPEVAKGRDDHIRANPTESLPPRPPLGPGLHDGGHDKRAGVLSEQPTLDDGRRLDDLVGHRFLVATAPDLLAGLTRDLTARIAASPEVVVISDPAIVGPLLASSGAGAVCVRPDRYVLGAADDAAALEALLNKVPTLAPTAASV
ncbi:bifunctional 3-(3-hydroxy-phenyl)propionate/3-hydroxycinnamic acid hydroxylase [Micromonospora globispora]|uniref:bifunctional 3-(3-hydroxy-phenyl)propionate/3-hydroxycinnamic acid hydroxylase n=1 Tax=Micromonospora globispora TaxID=1450148 RepID=UPI00140345CE|nr:bifunctional 3-(3-hydroxy-phenyl)propionate/3-hydroxycinnamic acid hydroxylase [Micromonospora globispora]